MLGKWTDTIVKPRNHFKSRVLKTVDLALCKYRLHKQLHLQKFRAAVTSRSLWVFFIATCVEQYG